MCCILCAFLQYFSADRFVVRGRCVHKEIRDPLTGVYPLTLFVKQHNFESNLQNRGGGSSLSSFGKNISLEKARETLCYFVQWAKASIEKEKKEREKNSKNSFNYLPNAHLARFYIRENMSDIERWHDKLGHRL